MRTRVPRALPALAIVALIVLAGACARRPVVPVASAPAPSRAVEAPPPAPAPAPVAPPPVAPAPVAPAPPPPPAPVVVAPPPAPALAPVKEFRSSDNVRPIYFDFDKAQVRPGDAKILVANAAWLNANPGYLLLIEGHCDERGTNEYNLALGDRRAKATMEFLVAQGVKMDRMSTISYGEERPTCTSHDEACWAKNRRSQFLVKEQ
jgi:peptidoglycan-associated lipoprotein